MSKTLNPQEAHYLAMNIVGEELQKEGYEFLAINSTLKKNPQFVMLKNKITSFIIVRSVSTIDDTTNYSKIVMEPIVKHAQKNNADVFYAGVLLGHGSNINLPAIHGEEYSYLYNGLTKVL